MRVKRNTSSLDSALKGWERPDQSLALLISREDLQIKIGTECEHNNVQAIHATDPCLICRTEKPTTLTEGTSKCWTKRRLL